MSDPRRASMATAAVVANATAAVSIAVAWSAAAGRLTVPEQLPWLSAAALVVLAAAAADALFVVSWRRGVVLRLATVAAGGGRLALAAPGASRDSSMWPAGTSATGTAGAAAVPTVTVAGGTRAHLSACPLVAGKQTFPAAAGLPACGVCRP